MASSGFTFSVSQSCKSTSGFGFFKASSFNPKTGVIYSGNNAEATFLVKPSSLLDKMASFKPLLCSVSKSSKIPW
jgi:hypothetical protein